MTAEEKLRELILSRYKSILDFTDASHLKYSTVMSILNRGVLNASVSNVIALCAALGISADALADGNIVYTMKRDDNPESIETAFAVLSDKLRGNEFTYDGQPLSEAESESLRNMLEISLEILKRNHTRQ